MVGDARISLEHESPQKFDVLVLDAFSGDAIPAHLLTREAMEIYCRHLASDGILAVHISNLHFDLSPVVAGLADEAGMTMRMVISKANGDRGTNTAFWALVTSQSSNLQIKSIESVARKPNSRRVVWTDRYSNLFGILKDRSN